MSSTSIPEDELPPIQPRAETVFRTVTARKPVAEEGKPRLSVMPPSTENERPWLSIAIIFAVLVVGGYCILHFLLHMI